MSLGSLIEGITWLGISRSFRYIYVAYTWTIGISASTAHYGVNSQGANDQVYATNVRVAYYTVQRDIYVFSMLNTNERMNQFITLVERLWSISNDVSGISSSIARFFNDCSAL